MRLNDVEPTTDKATHWHVIEVVLCKDCRWSCPIPKEKQVLGEYHCEYWSAEMHEDDFCSKAFIPCRLK